jgi:hypothetical protein
MKKYLFSCMLIFAILVSAFVAVPALASTYTPQSYDWCDTEAECLEIIFAATEVPTEIGTVTPDPTQEVTEIPIVTQEPTETPIPTDLPTEAPTETPVVIEQPSETPLPTELPIFTTEEPTQKPDFTSSTGGTSCYDAWMMIQSVYNKDVGYRFFDNPNHIWCQSWLLREYRIDYEFYKTLNP